MSEKVTTDNQSGAEPSNFDDFIEKWEAEHGDPGEMPRKFAQDWGAHIIANPKAALFGVPLADVRRMLIKQPAAPASPEQPPEIVHRQEGTRHAFHYATAQPTAEERLAEKLGFRLNEHRKGNECLEFPMTAETKPTDIAYVRIWPDQLKYFQVLWRECLSLMERIRTAGDLAVFIKDILLPKLRIKADLYEQEICGLERMLNGTHAHSLSKQLAEAMERVRTAEAKLDAIQKPPVGLEKR